jgi:diacylglycerol kinase family enzyme
LTHPFATFSEQASLVLLAVNPRAGAGRVGRADQLARALVDQGLSVQLETNLDSLAAAVEQGWGERRLRLVVAVGGDGTAAEVVNRTSPGVPLAVLATGTANLLAHYLGLSRDPLQLARTIAAGRTVNLDAGRANGRVFLLMAGCGFDAEVVQRLHVQRQGPVRYWSYLKPIVQAIRSYSYPAVRVYCDPGPEAPPPVDACWAFVVNLPPYAAGLSMAPLADGQDGYLDVATYRRGSLLQGLRYLAYIVPRQQRRLADCRIVRARRVRLESDDPVPYQLDGDPGGHLPLDIEVLPSRLTLLVPPDARRGPARHPA